MINLVDAANNYSETRSMSRIQFMLECSFLHDFGLFFAYFDPFGRCNESICCPKGQHMLTKILQLLNYHVISLCLNL